MQNYQTFMNFGANVTYSLGNPNCFISVLNQLKIHFPLTHMSISSLNVLDNIR